MTPTRCLALAAVSGGLFCASVSIAAERPLPPDGRLVIDLPEPHGGEFVLPQQVPNITAAYLAGDPQRSPLVVGFNKDATRVSIDLPADATGQLVLELAEETRQFVGGRIALSALDARVEGSRAKLESHPGNHRIGFWSSIEDSVQWGYEATRPGMYDVELTYSAAGESGSEIEVMVGGEKLPATLAATGSWYRYTTMPLGRIYLDKPGAREISIRGIRMSGGALMNLKALVLRPAPEGQAIVQAADGRIELDARDATSHGSLLQYERNPKKLCLGYWTKPEDWASWEFAVAKPGKFKILLTQGCGARQGGSKVDLIAGGTTFPFVVEDTGGFQNWKEREIGVVDLAAGDGHRLEVRPQAKAGVAVMDIRRVRLVPVD